MSRALLVAVFLASPSFAGAENQTFCPAPTIDQFGEAVPMTLAGVPDADALPRTFPGAADGDAVSLILAGAPECANFLKMAARIETLRDAANLLLGEQGKTLFPEGRPTAAINLDANAANAYYDSKRQVIRINPAMLRKFPAESPAASFMLAHELGHGVQDLSRDWIPLEADDGFVRAWESHADAIAAQILVRAGLPTETARLGWEGMAGCSAIKAGRGGGGETHGDDSARWVGQLIVAQKIEAAAANRAAERLKSQVSGIGQSDGQAALEKVFEGGGSASGTVDGPKVTDGLTFRPSDFDGRGAVNPAVIDAPKPRHQLPPKSPLILISPDAPGPLGVLNQMASSWGHATGLARTVWNGLFYGPQAEVIAARACGVPGVKSYEQALNFGIARIAKERTTAMVASAVRPNGLASTISADDLPVPDGRVR